MNLSIQLLGIPWYQAEDYAAIKALMVDSKALPATYARWRLQAAAIEERLQDEGNLVYRAALRPDAFRAFCAEHGLELDAEGREEFATRAALQAYRNGQMVTLYRSGIGRPR